VRIRVEVVRALPRRAKTAAIVLPEGATVEEALRAAGFGAGSAAGIFGEQVPSGTRLRDGDRVEVYRALKLDPREARRRRAKRKR
jgi:putative ubiquitin-RnfH superfamily antitoxin RatB of RatAB toxin-antitoxin module